MKDLAIWSEENLEKKTRAFVETEGLKLGLLAQPLRALLTGRLVSPPVFHVMEILGRDIVLLRLEKGFKTLKNVSRKT